MLGGGGECIAPGNGGNVVQAHCPSTEMNHVLHSRHAAEEGRKAAFALRGEKLAVAAARHYLVAVIADDAAGEPGQVRAVC